MCTIFYIQYINYIETYTAAVGTPIEEDICSLEVAPGPCKGAIPRYYYDGETCTGFTYGGCLGNANNFESLVECQNECDICSLPMAPGPCRGSIRRFFYNPAKNQCVSFTYGGCEGNANNFETKAACRKACKQ